MESSVDGGQLLFFISDTVFGTSLEFSLSELAIETFLFTDAETVKAKWQIVERGSIAIEELALIGSQRWKKLCAISEFDVVDFTFFGKVHPERASLSISAPTMFETSGNAGPEKYKIVVHIYANQIMARVTAHEGTALDLPTLRNFVTEHVQSIVDLCSFLYQRSYEVEIASCINNERPTVASTFGIELDVTGEETEERATRFSDFLSVLGHTPYVSLALSDLRAAMRNPMDTGVHCYRAFESILSDFEVGHPTEGGAKSTKKPKYDIEQMGADLNLGSAKQLKRFLGRHAGDRRHGKPVFISWGDRKAIMARSWLLMDRYLEYLKRGRAPLPKGDFPEPDFS